MKANILHEFEWDDYKLFDIMMNCLEENPQNRLEIYKIKKKMQALMIQNSIKPNLMDNIINMMSFYTKSLEIAVKAKTIEFQNERKLTERLIERILPKEIANQLSHGLAVEAESYDQVNFTIYLNFIKWYKR